MQHFADNPRVEHPRLFINANMFFYFVWPPSSHLKNMLFPKGIHFPSGQKENTWALHGFQKCQKGEETNFQFLFKTRHFPLNPYFEWDFSRCFSSLCEAQAAVNGFPAKLGSSEGEDRWDVTGFLHCRIMDLIGIKHDKTTMYIMYTS